MSQGHGQTDKGLIIATIIAGLLGIGGVIIPLMIQNNAEPQASQATQQALESTIAALSSPAVSFTVQPVASFTTVPAPAETLPATSTSTPVLPAETTVNSPVIPTSTQVLQPTFTPTPLPPPTQVVINDLVVSANANNGVLFTAPVDGNYRFTIKDGTYCTMPGLCRTIIRAYVDQDIIWGDWYRLPHPMNMERELGCWEDATRQDPDCAIGKTTVVPMKAGQYIRWVIMDDQNSFGGNTGEVILSVEKLP